MLFKDQTPDIMLQITGNQILKRAYKAADKAFAKKGERSDGLVRD